METWVGEVVAEMHMKKITQKARAAQMGVTNEYICSILNGKREKILDDMERRIREAISQINAG